MTSQPTLKAAKLTALISFLVGTFIFLLYFKSGDSQIVFVGYGYTVIVGLINVAVFIALLVRAYKEKENRKRIIMTCGLMTLNVPVMLFYCWFVIKLLNTMRVTFINTTQMEISAIKIIGCELKQIHNLTPGESETIWIAITGDCSLDIEYITNGQKRNESVAGYCTNDMGQKLTHNIGGTNEPLF